VQKQELIEDQIGCYFSNLPTESSTFNTKLDTITILCFGQSLSGVATNKNSHVSTMLIWVLNTVSYSSKITND